MSPGPELERELDKLLGVDEDESQLHQWALLFAYRMSPADVAELVEGQRPDGPTAERWRPSGDRLRGIYGPICMCCKKSWGPDHDQPCSGPRIRTSRAERRQKERDERRRGREMRFEGSTLEDLLERLR